MEVFRDSPTFSTKAVIDKQGNVKKDSNGHEVRRVSMNFNWKIILSFIPALYLLINIGAFWAQTVDTTKVVKRLKSRVDTLQNKVIAEQQGTHRKIDLLITMLDPANGKSKIEEINKDTKALLKELEEKGKGNGN